MRSIHLDRMRTLHDLFKNDLEIEIDDVQMKILNEKLENEQKMDKNYWKDAYKEFWALGAKKEEFVKKLIESETGLEVVEAGLGAGNSGYIKGSAADNNFKKGDADLYVKGADAYIEVTGPNVPMPQAAALWFRPDKLNNTYEKIKNDQGKLHLIIHIQDIKGSDEKIVRGIHLSREFYDEGRKTFKRINPIIRGRQEKYIEIDSGSKFILTFDEIIGLIRSAAKQ